MSNLDFNRYTLPAPDMPQLDFRQAFAPSEQEPGIVIPPRELSHNNFAEGPAKISSGRFGTALGRSDWTNISFVTTATLGGLVCAFYFFNGGDVLRASAAWPREFLYPRPVTSVANTETLKQQRQQSVTDPVVSQSTPKTQSTRSAPGPFGRDYLGDSLSAPSTPSGIGSTSSVGTGFSPAVGSALSQLSSLPRGADALFQSLYQTVTAPSQVKSVASAIRRSVASTRKTIAAAKKIAGSQTSSTAKSVSSSTSQVSSQANRPAGSPLGPGPGGTGGLGGVGGLGAIGGGGMSLGGGLGLGGGGHGGGH